VATPSSDPIGVVWVTFDKRTGRPGHASQTIYVGVADLGTSIYRSRDGGASWEALPGQPTSPAFMPHHGVLASNGILYITYNNNAGPYDGTLGDVWKYDTTSGVWTKISPDPTSSTNVWFGYGGLAVDAQNPNVVMVSALNQWWPDAAIWRSTDAGATWKPIWEWGAYPTRILHYTQDISAAPWLTFNASPALPEITPKLGWMIGDLKIDPFNSNRLMYGTGATIYGSDDLFPDRIEEARRPFYSINYIIAHDGLTLYDLVSFEKRRNSANGHENTDGPADCYSFNCGTEGDEQLTEEILLLRKRQTKNLFCLLMLSNGIPMFLAGDEFLHTQHGNNNPYNQDNPTTWLDWSRLERNAEFFRFCKRMIAFRKAHPSICRSTRQGPGAIQAVRRRNRAPPLPPRRRSRSR